MIAYRLHQFAMSHRQLCAFLIRDEATGLAACVDTPDAPAILRELITRVLDPVSMILNTHWHPDHAGGNAELEKATGATIVGPGEVEDRRSTAKSATAT